MAKRQHQFYLEQIRNGETVETNASILIIGNTLEKHKDDLIVIGGGERPQPKEITLVESDDLPF